MDNYVGKRLDGRYEIQEIIGVGGMSVVYKAYDNIDDRVVAVKILKDEFLANEEFRRRFKNESKAIAVLNHPNIVRVFDVNFGERLQYIVMEYVDGITLKEYIQQQGTINWNDTVHFVCQILRALQHAHDKGIVHRDVKPQNIILLQNGTIKVTDFGIARFSRSDTRTMTEKAIGSVHYISPEQARGDLTDEKADIYSVGIVLYEMLTGRVPFEADSAVSVAIMQLQAEAVPPSQVNPSVPKGLEQITMHAMQKLSVDRYQTATEMLLDIDEFTRNPNATFDYSYFVDSQPTKFVSDFREATGEFPNGDVPMANDGIYEDAYLDENIDGYYDEETDEYYERVEEDRKKKNKMIATISVGVLALIASVVVLVLLLSGGFKNGKIVVPEMVGKNYTAIAEQYKDQFTFEANFIDSEYAPDSIVTQSVEKGKKVKRGSTIKLEVAKSSERVKVPLVAGKTLEDAKKELLKMNLSKIEVKELSSESVDEGLVISTTPGSGTEVSSTDKITVFVSSGTEKPASVKMDMPDFSGLDRSAINKQIEAMGFTNAKVRSEDSKLAKDAFISQSIRAKTQITKDTAFTVIVSSGTVPTTAPPTTESDTTEKPTTKPETKSIILSLTVPEMKNNDGSFVKYPMDILLDGKIIKAVTLVLDGNPMSVTVTAPANKTGKQDLTIAISELNFEKKIAVDFNKPSDNGYPVKIEGAAG